MKPWIAAVLVVAVAGCGGGLSPPRVLSISPSWMLESDAPEVTVEVEAIMRFEVDYDRSMATVSRTLFLNIGDEPVGDDRYMPNGLLVARVPSVFPAETYDVSVTLEDLRSAVLAGGFLVLPGAWPDGYTIDPIDDQEQGSPFVITIRATGPNGPTFQGTVNLSTVSGSLSPSRTGPFTNGIRMESVVFGAPQPATLIQVRDLTGRTVGSSNVFRVR